MATADETVGVRGRDRSPISVGVGLVALGHLGLLLVLPADPSLPSVGIVEAVALAILVAGQLVDGTALGHLLLLCVLFGGLIAVSVTLVGVLDSVLLASVVLTVAIALFAYGIHRYGLVALDRVEAPAGSRGGAG